MRNEDIERNDNEYLDLLTTVIGINCSNGIVIGTDSQATAKAGRTKDLQTEKILKINKFSALAGCGDSNHVKKLEYAILQRIGEKTLNNDDMIDILESILNKLYKKYNVQKSREMGFNDTKVIFHPLSIYGTKLKDDTFGLYTLRDDAFVSPVLNYIALGSGSDLAKLLLDMQSRFPASQSKTLANIGIEFNWFVACVTINEVKNFDSRSGGDTRIAIITKDGLENLPSEVISEAYGRYIEGISTEFGNAFKDVRAKEMFKQFYRK